MQHDPRSGAQLTPTASRRLQLYEILAVIVLWNSGYKGARVLNVLYALELGAQPLDTGLLLATYGVFPLLLAVRAGKIADRYGTRLPITAGLIISALGVLLPFLWPVFPALFVAAAVTGTGFILVQVSMQSFAGSLGSGPERIRNINLYALVISTADLIGPILAGFSIDQFGHVRTYLCLGVLNVASLFGLIYLFNRIPRAAPAAAGRGEQRMTDLFRDRNLRRVILTSGMIMTGVDLFQLYIPLYGHSIGLPAAAIGMILGAFAVAEFVTRTLTPALVRRFGEESTLLYAMTLAAGTFFLIPLFDAAVVLGVICFLLGLGMGLGQPLTVILTYNYSPAGRTGEALGLRIAVNNSMHVVVPVLFGAIGSAVGLSPVFWLGSAILALSGLASRKRVSA
ncbi:MAG: MFS transporter [Betaproteobacteria bacterium]|nr:MFS transporter [Betaproteobacteria bacterium]